MSENETHKGWNNNLCYYTNFEAFSGIIEKKEFWLCSTSSMNDSSEVKFYIDNLQKEARAELGSTREKEVADFFEKLISTQELFSPVTMSFSQNEDDAAMWDRYANSAKGVCIIFNYGRLVMMFSGSEFQIFNEKYSLEQDDIVPKGMVLDYLRGEEKYKSDINEVIDFVLMRACFFKHKGFKSENEVRLAWVHPDLIDDVDENRYIDISYIASPDRIRKVLKLNLINYCKKHDIDSEGLLDRIITKILVGPRSQQNVSDLKAYLISKGLASLAEKVYKSDCPLR